MVCFEFFLSSSLVVEVCADWCFRFVCFRSDVLCEVDESFVRAEQIVRSGQVADVFSANSILLVIELESREGDCIRVQLIQSENYESEAQHFLFYCGVDVL